ncbi:MAG: cell division protein ZapA [Acutalibacteraceae bacterium]|nr:cell division protein ZapA [Acutalibacteraceae bacterium]
MANQIKINVGGINYTVKSDESTEYLKELGEELEQRLRRITKQSPTASTTMAAIIAALEASDEAKKAKLELEVLKEQYKKLQFPKPKNFPEQRNSGRQMRLGDK